MAEAAHYTARHDRKNCHIAAGSETILGEIRGGTTHASLEGMTTITSFRDLLVWQKSMDLAVRCYRTARELPRQDQMVLGHQIQKSSISMPSNIAEGKSRHSTLHYIQHLWTAHGSGAELETQLELGARVEIVPVHLADALIRDAQEVGRMLNGLIRSLEPVSDRAGRRKG